jgi:hypothetical protein
MCLYAGAQELGELERCSSANWNRREESERSLSLAGLEANLAQKPGMEPERRRLMPSRGLRTEAM